MGRGRASEHDDHADNEGPWWRLDVAMVLVLLMIGVFLMIIFFEFLHPHVFNH